MINNDFQHPHTTKIDAAMKMQAEAVFLKISIAPSDVIRIPYHQVIMQQGLPYTPRMEITPVQVDAENIDKIRAAIRKSVTKNKVALVDLAKR